MFNCPRCLTGRSWTRLHPPPYTTARLAITIEGPAAPLHAKCRLLLLPLLQWVCSPLQRLLLPWWPTLSALSNLVQLQGACGFLLFLFLSLPIWKFGPLLLTFSFVFAHAAPDWPHRVERASNSRLQCGVAGVDLGGRPDQETRKTRKSGQGC